MVTNDVSTEAKKLLSYFFTHVIDIDYLIFNGAVNPSILKSKPHYAKVWTKFQALRLVEYDKICHIDADYLPLRSMLNVFQYETPAAVTEVPTGINTEKFDLSRDRTYAPEWEDLFGSCCQSGRSIPGIVLLMLMYSNNIDSESGRYSTNPSFTGNFYYGGMNASVMLLQPNIYEFRKIMDDLSTYDAEKRLTFFYPEQQYLTVRYAFGKDLRPEEIPEIIKEFLDFINPHFELEHFKNILSKTPISLCQSRDISSFEDFRSQTPCFVAKDIHMTQVINIINILTNILLYYITIQSKGQPSNIGQRSQLGGQGPLWSLD